LGHEWEQAARRGDVKTLRRLLTTGADIDARDRHGQTALMIAAREGHAGVVRFLVEQGADLNHSAKYRLSALMLAVIHGHIDIVRTLVEAGADPAIRGSGAPGFSGKTALDLAIAQGRSDMAEVLRKSE
jgi:ankyrin repeat protein